MGGFTNPDRLGALTRRALGLWMLTSASAAAADLSSFRSSMEHLGSVWGSSTAQLRNATSPAWLKISGPAAMLAPMPSIGSCGLWQDDKKIAHSGTAWVAAPGVVVTAAHVIDLVKRQLQIAAEASIPRVRTCIAFADPSAGLGAPIQFDVASAKKYRNASEARFDVARIPLPTQASPVPILSSSPTPRWACVEVPGYPECRISQSEIYDGSGLYADHRSASRDGPFVTYDADTEYGHSGAPVLLCDNVASAAIAIHVGSDYGKNQGVFIDATLHNFILRG